MNFSYLPGFDDVIFQFDLTLMHKALREAKKNDWNINRKQFLSGQYKASLETSLDFIK